MSIKNVTIIVFFTNIISLSESGHILAIMPTPSYSHQIVYNSLWATLNSEGHHITLLTTDPIKNMNSTNFRQVDWSFAYGLWHEKHNVTDIINNFNSNLIKSLIQYVEMMNDIISQELEHPDVQKIIADPNEHFDLLIVEYLNPAMIAFSKRFSCPFIGVSPMDITNFAHEALGNCISPAVFPDFIAPFDTEMNFFERIMNTFYYLGSKLYFKYYLYPQMDKIVKKHFGNDIPKLEDLQQNASMIFLNINPIIHNIRPMMNNILTIGGGAHFESHISLPPDIQTFLDEAFVGVIYFSLGTNVKSKDLSMKIKEVFVETFAEIQYKVLWKFEDTSIATNSNIMIKKWLPQQQILKHPNVKLFITQGGLQSLEEAICNGIPIIAFPAYIDQYSNVRRVIRKGMGVALDREQLNKQILTDTIHDVIKNPEYKRAAEKLSTLLKEQPTPALNLTVWWVNYVLKYGGAKYLQHSRIPLYQYLLLDVIIFFTFLILIITLLAYFLLRIFITFVKNRNKSKLIKLE